MLLLHCGAACEIQVQRGSKFGRGGENRTLQNPPAASDWTIVASPASDSSTWRRAKITDSCRVFGYLQSRGIQLPF
ncbi:hypothetical protein CEXT_97381 [Caerostris extrusa]|uniref:Uncharacterized protein n=1 Tax=Caerostris extrusa TaxID=172846 RepID=A0AAV4MAC5_CAEEX|nr:hypothetical protein CEXT_97381 [Caerostris extrusa]